MGSDINAQIETNRNTALTLACFQGRHEVVSLLLDRKANVEHRAKTGLTPLMEAASGGFVDVGRVLLDKNADVNAPPVPSSRDTALTIAADKGHYRFVELLLSRGAQVDVRNKKGNSSLWLAANGGHLDVVQLLHHAAADIDSQDNRKVSCLMAAFRKGHSKVVKWMVKHVSQFPSDQELTRYIATVTDKDLAKKCNACMDIIRVAKDKQAAEAAKNANNLLEELDREKNMEESKKAAAARKREKKKRKKAEKKSTTTAPTADDDNQETTEDEKEKTPAVSDTANIEGDSGIDANSQGSSGSREEQPPPVPPPQERPEAPPKEEKKSGNGSKKQKKRQQKTNGVHNSGSGSDHELTPPPPPSVSAASKPAAEQKKEASRVPETHQQHHVPPTEPSPPQQQPNGKKSRQKQKTESNSPRKSGKSPQTPSNQPKEDQGWKEVVRKSRKVTVAANAISRVIGRGGHNINAIRELSGAHIEVEKQGKGAMAANQDRTILIKGSAEATRQATQWINAIISNPEKDIADIIGKPYKLYQQSLSAAAAAATARSASPPAAAAVASPSSASPPSQSPPTKPSAAAAQATAPAVAGSKKPSTPVANPRKPDTAARGQKQAKTGSPVPTPAQAAAAAAAAKVKAATSSFAAVAGGGSSTDALGMISTVGPPPLTPHKRNKSGNNSSAVVPPGLPASTAGGPFSDKKPAFGNPSYQPEHHHPLQPQQPPPPQRMLDNNEGFSPFKSLSGVWDDAPSMDSVLKPQFDDLACKAPGYRSNRINSSDLFAVAGSQGDRCNSAPGTPVNAHPAPIGPPPQQKPPPEPEYRSSRFIPAAGMRSITPQANDDFNFRDRQPGNKDMDNISLITSAVQIAASTSSQSSLGLSGSSAGGYGNYDHHYAMPSSQQQPTGIKNSNFVNNNNFGFGSGSDRFNALTGGGFGSNSSKLNPNAPHFSGDFARHPYAPLRGTSAGGSNQQQAGSNSSSNKFNNNYGAKPLGTSAFGNMMTPSLLHTQSINSLYNTGLSQGLSANPAPPPVPAPGAGGDAAGPNVLTSVSITELSEMLGALQPEADIAKSRPIGSERRVLGGPPPPPQQPPPPVGLPPSAKPSRLPWDAQQAPPQPQPPLPPTSQSYYGDYHHGPAGGGVANAGNASGGTTSGNFGHLHDFQDHFDASAAPGGASGFMTAPPVSPPKNDYSDGTGWGNTPAAAAANPIGKKLGFQGSSGGGVPMRNKQVRPVFTLLNKGFGAYFKAYKYQN